MAISYERFLNERLNARWGPSAKEVEAIRELFRGNIDAIEAAKRLTEDVNASRTADQAEGQLWGMWNLVADVSAKFPTYHEKLVDVVRIIHTFPDQTLHDPGAVVKWSDLPILGPTWAETVFNWSAEGGEVSLDEHINHIAFTARLSALGIPGADMTSHCEDAMHRAFEITPESENELDGSALRSLNINIPIAAQWIIYCGERILRTSGETYDRATKLEGLWSGPPGFSRDRWDFWWRRALWAASLRSVRNETKEAAESIVRAMENLDLNPQV